MSESVPEPLLTPEISNEGQVVPARSRLKAATMAERMRINISAMGRSLKTPFASFDKWWSTDRASGRKLSSLEKRVKLLKLVRLLSIVAVVGVVGAYMSFFVLLAVYGRDLPKPGEIVRREGFSTKILDRHGTLLYDLHADERREPIQIAQVPDSLKHATVAVEDKDFYKHGGVDPLTPFRIVYNYIFRGGRVVGGSTLTQQLVKNVLLTNERSLGRKFREILLSLQIERTFTKDQILEMYLNEAPYGGNILGVGTASQFYFNKPVEQLTPLESAILAGLPQRPTAYSPIGGKKDENGVPLWRSRTLGVLRRMNEDGYLTGDAYNQALQQLDTIEFNQAKFEIRAPHFVFYVREKLVEQFGEAVVNAGGLEVTTTLDLPLHDQAQTIVKEEIEKVKNVNITNGASVVMNPQSGEILSMVGSIDYFSDDIDGEFNVAADGLRQPGSSIKPVVYLGMLQKGYTPATMLADVPTTFIRNASEKKYEPKNYDGKFRGPVNLRNSLGSSLNIPAVKSLALVGVEDFLTQAYKMGFPTLEPSQANLSRFGLALSLGGGEVHLIDTVSAYSSFANGGRKVEPVSILKVTDLDGTVLYEHRNVDGQQVMTPEESFLINNILSDNTARSIAFGSNSLLNTNRPVAVKTGTTNDRKDNWTIGWSRDLMVGVWVGNNDNSEMKQVASGITGASPIWRRILNYGLENGYKAPAWEIPAGIEEVDVDAISGYPAHDGYPSRKEYVVRGTLPSLPDPVHAKLKLCRADNSKLASDAQVGVGDYDEKEFIVLRENDPFSQDGANRWQEGIDAWVSGQTDGKYKAPNEVCGQSTDVTIRMGKPENEKKYDSEDIDVELDAGSGDGIEKMELWVDGSLRETITNRSYRGKIKLGAGQHELYAVAKSRGGKEAKTSTVRIGTGGQDWKKPDPSPTPSPTPSPAAPSPSPTTTPIVPLLTPTPSPSPT